MIDFKLNCWGILTVEIIKISHENKMLFQGVDIQTRNKFMFYFEFLVLLSLNYTTIQLLVLTIFTENACLWKSKIFTYKISPEC